MMNDWVQWLSVTGLAAAAAAVAIAWLRTSAARIKAQMDREATLASANLAREMANAEREAKLTARVDDLTAQTFKQNDEILLLHRKSAECEKREADQRAEVTALSNEVRMLKAGIQSTMPQPGMVVADLRGIVQVYSPAVTPILKWLPKEVLGRSVEMLVPPDLLDKHRTAFGKFAERGVPPGYDRVLQTYALDKLGGRVPVEIHLTGWMTHGNEGMVTAEIRQMAVAKPAASP